MNELKQKLKDVDDVLADDLMETIGFLSHELDANRSGALRGHLKSQGEQIKMAE